MGICGEERRRRGVGLVCEPGGGSRWAEYLFSVFGSAEEKIKAMSSLRQRVLPREVLLKLPKVSSFCLLLLHPHPNSRPKISEVLLSDFLNEPRERLQECETAIKVKEEIDENELLLEFLLQLQQRKQEAADKLHDTICLLSSDFEEVVVHQSISKKCGSLFEKSIEDELLAAEKVEKPLLLPASQKADRSKLYSSVEKLDEDYTCSGSRKRSKLSTVWDVTKNQLYAEMGEHERRVWSVDISKLDPTMLASGCDDGTVKIWNMNQAIHLAPAGGSSCTIKTNANVCSVQFSPDSSHFLAIGSADHRVYCYDRRNIRVPSCTFIGHSKTVSYVKFVDSSTLLSASIDSSLKLWDLSTCTSRVIDNSLQTFTGHTNLKNFVGLSISNGYIATGSETNEVFVYHKAFPMPVLSYKFNSEDPIYGREVDDAMHFVSCVCWRGQSSTLLAANSSEAVLAPHTGGALVAAAAAVVRVVGHRRARAAAAQLPEPARAPACAAVPRVPENVDALPLAALLAPAALSPASAAAPAVPEHVPADILAALQFSFAFVLGSAGARVRGVFGGVGFESIGTCDHGYVAKAALRAVRGVKGASPGGRGGGRGVAEMVVVIAGSWRRGRVSVIVVAAPERRWRRRGCGSDVVS
ncbi:Protein SPA1-RELATED 3 [Ananas comosus]|uniref:Protein SPA1-RELATED 3 n=1 Tax=Ananas comosus TaxID=4615 RepID=A0A199V1H9_ANACO|nr:Protein SPA1-RELATED 3 [Ananas comosus]